MGLLSWFRGSPKPQSKTNDSLQSATKAELPAIAGMNGAVEVPKPPGDFSVFEFGLAKSTADKVTLAGYCPVSDDLEPCKWQIVPSSDADAPQFRIVF